MKYLMVKISLLIAALNLTVPLFSMNPEVNSITSRSKRPHYSPPISESKCAPNKTKSKTSELPIAQANTKIDAYEKKIQSLLIAAKTSGKWNKVNKEIYNYFNDTALTDKVREKHPKTKDIKASHVLYQAYASTNAVLRELKQYIHANISENKTLTQQKLFVSNWAYFKASLKFINLKWWRNSFFGEGHTVDDLSDDFKTGMRERLLTYIPNETLKLCLITKQHLESLNSTELEQALLIYGLIYGNTIFYQWEFKPHPEKI